MVGGVTGKPVSMPVPTAIITAARITNTMPAIFVLFINERIEGLLTLSKREKEVNACAPTS